MKILHVTDGIPPDVLGGTGRIVWETAQAMAACDHAVSLLSSGEQASRVQSGKPEIFTIPRLPTRFAHFRSVFSFSRAAQVRGVIEHLRPDIIHAHSIANQCGYRWIADATALGIPVIHTAHDVSDIACGKVTGKERSIGMKDFKRMRWQFNPFRNSRIKHFLKSCHKILTVSDALGEYLRHFGYENATTLYNGIDLAFWKTARTREEARKELGLPIDSPLFLFAGRLGHDKGSTLLAATLPASAHLILAGENWGSLFEDVKDRVHLFPRQSAEQMILLYDACDAVLVPSRCLDCFPTVCLEAMAMGRVVLATSWGGAKEAVVDGVTGWIIDPLDEPAWREKMSWVCAHRTDMRPMESAARRRMEEKFSLERNVDRLLAMYNEAITKRTTGQKKGEELQ